MEQLYFAYPWLFYYLGGALVVGAIAAIFLKRRIRYQYALATTLQKTGLAVRIPIRQVMFATRFLMLFVLALLIARPQWIERERSVSIHGVDIVLTMDISGSMEFFDDLQDRTPRVEAARKEALDFIERRTNDAIGIVLFGAQALSKVPLTLDKTLLKEVMRDVAIGDVDPDGTALLTAVGTSINRLKDSPAKTKVIVLLTDGVPSPDDPVSADMVIDLAKQFGIKIYTLGVGRAQNAYAVDGWGRTVQVPTQIDTVLLKKIAQETGGKYYRVYLPADLKAAYDDIDRLEKTEYNTTLFQHTTEAFAWFIWVVIVLFVWELLCKLWLWRGML